MDDWWHIEWIHMNQLQNGGVFPHKYAYYLSFHGKLVRGGGRSIQAKMEIQLEHNSILL